VKQFIINSVPDRNGRIKLEGSDYTYLVKVRRLAPGEYFPALLSGGRVFVRVVSVDKHVLVGEVVQDGMIPADSVSAGLAPDELVRGELVHPSPLPPITLFQALPKSDKMDLIVRQAAESALAGIVPFVSEFSVAKINASGQKIARWERIIKEARQQCGSMVATAIRQPLPIDKLFEYWEEIKIRKPGTLGLLFHHLSRNGVANESLHDYIGNSIKKSLSVNKPMAYKHDASGWITDGHEPGAVVIAIGPEGGFSSTEVERFLAAGFRPFTIGDTVLRTETAALYAQAAVRVLLLERNSWKTM
jgi:16S rRNA (uracil1498-N3)-methyltransferase